MAKSSFTRREFLKVSALNTSVLALGACSSLDRFFTGDKRDLTNEVVILGAGAAGLAAAAELKKRKIPFRLFESSSRVGGRVQSVKVFPELDSVAELGAEFIEGNHSHVMGLAKELNLSLNEIKTVPGLEAHLFSFNKKIYQIKDIAPRLKSLREPFQNLRTDLFDDDEDVVLNFKNAGQYAQSKYYDSLSLKALLDSWAGEVDPVILKLIEIQSVQRFGVEAKDQSCLHFISTLDETGSSLLMGRPLYAMAGGLSRLTQTLAERVAGVIPDRIVKLNSPLVKISEEQNVFTLTFESERRKEIYHARHVICTLPFSKLREVSGIESLKFSALKKDNIFGQSYGTHSKGVLGFSSPFWRSRHGNVPGRLGNYTGDFLTQKMWDASRE
ncbi:MAG: flavin monoamine oxidase family protein, partial [Bdellovibrio sp.]